MSENIRNSSSELGVLITIPSGSKFTINDASCYELCKDLVVAVPDQFLMINANDVAVVVRAERVVINTLTSQLDIRNIISDPLEHMQVVGGYILAKTVKSGEEAQIKVSSDISIKFEPNTRIILSRAHDQYYFSMLGICYYQCCSEHVYTYRTADTDPILQDFRGYYKPQVNVAPNSKRLFPKYRNEAKILSNVI